jgi:hypothetical protein
MKIFTSPLVFYLAVKGGSKLVSPFCSPVVCLRGNTLFAFANSDPINIVASVSSIRLSCIFGGPSLLSNLSKIWLIRERKDTLS